MSENVRFWIQVCVADDDSISASMEGAVDDQTMPIIEGICKLVGIIPDETENDTNVSTEPDDRGTEN